MCLQGEIPTVCVLSQHTAAIKSWEQLVCFCFDLYCGLPILDVLERVLSLLRAAWSRLALGGGGYASLQPGPRSYSVWPALHTGGNWGLKDMAAASKQRCQNWAPGNPSPQQHTSPEHNWANGTFQAGSCEFENLSVMGVAGPLLCRLKGLDLSSTRDLNSSNGSMLSQRIAWVAVAVIWISVIPQWLWLKMYFLIFFPPPTFIHHTVHHKVFHSNFILDKNYPCGWQNEEHAFISFLICYLCGNLTARSGWERVKVLQILKMIHTTYSTI